MLLRYISAIVVFALLSWNAPAFAVDAKQKKETCEFGANDQKLAGAARKKFMSKCMANDDKPAKHQKMQPPPQQQK
jgi:psiF repeat